jgi:hypothetical protein
MIKTFKELFALSAEILKNYDSYHGGLGVIRKDTSPVLE